MTTGLALNHESQRKETPRLYSLGRPPGEERHLSLEVGFG